MKLNQKADLFSEALKNELIEIRNRCGLSKNEAATRAGLAVSFVSYLESGKRRPTVETLAKLAWVYDTTPSAILLKCEKALESEA